MREETYYATADDEQAIINAIEQQEEIDESIIAEYVQLAEQDDYIDWKGILDREEDNDDNDNEDMVKYLIFERARQQAEYDKYIQYNINQNKI